MLFYITLTDKDLPLFHFCNTEFVLYLILFYFKSRCATKKKKSEKLSSHVMIFQQISISKSTEKRKQKTFTNNINNITY